MRSYKYRYNLDKYLKRNKWDPYAGYKKGRKYSNILPSLFYENQTWGALHKCWIGYCIAINKGEYDKEIMYASRIQNLQKELGIKVSYFECLDEVDQEDIELIEESMGN